MSSKDLERPNSSHERGKFVPSQTNFSFGSPGKSHSVFNSGPGSDRLGPPKVNNGFSGNDAAKRKFGTAKDQPPQKISDLARDGNLKSDLSCVNKDIDSPVDPFGSSNSEVDDLKAPGAPPIRQIWFDEYGNKKTRVSLQESHQSRSSALQTPEKRGQEPILNHSQASHSKISQGSLLSPNKFETPPKQRIRSPSPASEKLLNTNGNHAYDSMKRDKRHGCSAEDNEDFVVKEIRRPLPDKDIEKGVVYLLRDPVLDLIKVGKTSRGLNVRAKELYKCRASDSKEGAVYIVEEVEIYASNKLERLVQKDLQSHRWFFECSCRGNDKKPFTEHKEWFEVSEEEAIKTLHLWRDFLLQNPYGTPSMDSWGSLMPAWQRELSERLYISPTEECGHYEMRIRRWRTLLILTKEQIAEAMLPTTAAMDSPLSAKHKGAIVDQGNEREVETKVESDLETEPTRTQSAVAQSIESLKSAEGTTDTDPLSVDIKASKASCGTEDMIKDAAGLNGRQQQNAIDGDSSSDAAVVEDDTFLHTNIPSLSDASAGNLEPSIAPDGVKVSANGLDFESICLDDIKRSFSKTLMESYAFLFRRHPEKKIPTRTPLEDIVQFRWPLLCAFTTALHAPYVPHFLSFLTWMVVLPSLVGELRGWW